MAYDEATFEHCLVCLQAKCGLTYREARAYLAQDYLPAAETIRRDGKSQENYYNLVRKAQDKIDRSGLTLDEIYEGRSLDVALF